MTNPLELPFDTEEMIAGLRPWIETESPTFDAGAVNRMMDLVQHDLAALGARVERIPGRMGFGDSVRATMPHPRAGEGGILLLGHMDTVHPVGTLQKLPFRREGGLCYGPGLMDMKGGNYVFLDALRKLLAAGVETPLPVTVLFTPDEEVGTPSTRALIEACRADGSADPALRVVIGVDPTPRPIPPLAKLGVVFASLPLHAFFGVVLMGMSTVLGADFYRSLKLDWHTDLLGDQKLGGGIAWAAGEVPLVIVLVALFVQWRRSDQRTATRLDRAAERDDDADLAAYNAMLAEMARRDRAGN